jgi:ribosomal subunit interface protein
MQIDIKARQFPLTDALYGHAERRLHFALSSYGDQIRRVIVRLSDINGPRGGADKRCHLQVMLVGLPDIVVEDTEPDLYVAINRATDRAGRTLMRKFNRHRSLLKQAHRLAPDVQQSFHPAGKPDTGSIHE